MVRHNTIKILSIQCLLMSLRKKSGCCNTKGFGMRLSHCYLKKLATEPIKGEDKYVYGKLKT